ncbi:alpha/beta hydrolase (plasmid) [Deinococcus sp. KNUC1210]|uniref:alpha/beta fold hydrolase n=1 Tax=Deinococcus sp. KNUC1210 TaxID=2917691 RepID=UPI001EF061C5|nr:alpha/beta hydrolase [Deinococcus sp. KNUC1210]ULH18343.1 alpha/beta hydrolase [Deinococcus sp. KNUC1210]
MTLPDHADLARRSNTHVFGTGPQTLLCAHGFCSQQDMFRHQVRDFHFRATHRIVTYDLAGFGRSDPQLWHAQRHARLEGYAEDMLRLIDELDLHDIVLLGASMSAVVGMLAAVQRPERFRALVLIGASPRYLNDGAYLGGFEQADVDAVYELVRLQRDWAGALSSMMLNQPNALALQEITEDVRAVRSEVVRVVARAVFQSDYRSLLPEVRHPVLITQTRADRVVPVSVGEYLQRTLQQAQLTFIPGAGHLPNFTEPGAFNDTLRTFLARVGATNRNDS